MAIFIRDKGVIEYENQNDVKRDLFANKLDADTVNKSLNDFIDSFSNVTELPAVAGDGGYCMYIKVGRVVICSGTVNATGERGDFLVTGLPKPVASNAGIPVNDNNQSTPSFKSITLGGNGDIKLNQAMSGASLRFMFSYISAE